MAGGPARIEANLGDALAQIQAARQRRTSPVARPTEGRSGSWSRHWTVGA